MRAYSVDLRERTVEAVKSKGLSKTAAAELYGVSRATVYRYLELAAEGSLVAKVRPGQLPRLDEQARKKLLEQVNESNDLSLEEHAVKVSKEQGIELKKSAVANYFTRLGVKRKKDAASPRA